MSSFYGLNESIKSFAIANEFVVQSNKACYKLGQSLMPFCVFRDNEAQEQYNVPDIANFGAFMNQEITLVDEIYAERAESYKEVGISVTEAEKKYVFFDYLLSISACYVEVPKYTTKDGMAMPTYDKFLCTRNPAIMATWMGAEANEMQAKYSHRIKTTQIDFANGDIKVVKLMSGAKGNSISVPRVSYNVEKMTCVPLYMLYAFIEGIKPIMQDNIVKFTFLKDNGTVRELPTTLNEGILKRYYDDNMFISQMLSGVDINTVKQGGMMLSSKMNRGYIKVPEVGASIYDGTGVRSLNIARLLKAEIVTDVDTSFIKVDLNSVETNFGDAMDYLVKTFPDLVKPCYVGLTTKEPESDEPVVIAMALKEYVRSNITFLSTTYARQLHKFMIDNPLWFPLYTGMPNKSIVSSTNIGAEPVPLDDFM